MHTSWWTDEMTATANRFFEWCAAVIALYLLALTMYLIFPYFPEVTFIGITYLTFGAVRRGYGFLASVGLFFFVIFGVGSDSTMIRALLQVGGVITWLCAAVPGALPIEMGVGERRTRTDTTL